MQVLKAFSNIHFIHLLMKKERFWTKITRNSQKCTFLAFYLTLDLFDLTIRLWNMIGNTWHYSKSILSLENIFKYSFGAFIDHKRAFLDENYVHFWPFYLMLNWFDLAISSWHYSASILSIESSFKCPFHGFSDQK